MSEPATPTNAEGVGMRTSEAPFAAADGYAAALDKSEAEWKEATAMAEAWCQEKDPYKRDRAIYCYRAGYLKAKRHTDPSSATACKRQPERKETDQ